MGSGIAEVCAKAGYDTVVREVSDELVKKGLGRIEGSLGKAVEKGKLPAAERDAAWKRISSTTRLKDLADCDLIIEAIVENLELKKETYRTLDAACKPATSAIEDPGGATSNTTACARTMMACACERSPTSPRTTARSVLFDENISAASSALAVSSSLRRTGAFAAVSRLASADISLVASPSSDPTAIVSVVGREYQR